MKKLMIAGIVAACAIALEAAPTTTRTRTGRRAAATAAADDGETAGSKVKVHVEQYPKLGRQSTLAAPSINGGSVLGQAWNGKPRQWIVLESKYSTTDKCIDQLTFTWHVLLETKSATAKDKEGQSKMPPYSYFTQTVSYANIPRGTHAASVCLHPSYLEQYGEPKAVGLVISDSSGNEITGDALSEIKGIDAHKKFWEDQSIMDAKQGGEPMIERRQGLQDRSKTIWALVNPNDYELVIQ